MVNFGLTSASRSENKPCLDKVVIERPIYELPCQPCKEEKPCKEDVCCDVIKCRGILPPCCRVTSRDFIKTGDLSRAYRKASKKCEYMQMELNEAIILCTKQSHCKSLSFARFYAAVLDTARIVSRGKVCSFGPHEKKVIHHIYTAGVKSGATCEQLIVFTATAMHNCYLFSYFPETGINCTIGSISRGLMQWTSREGYTNLSKVSAINYLQQPYAVEMYNSETVLNEVDAYLRFYNNCALSGVNAYIYTIKAFGSQEAGLVNEVVAYECLMGLYRPTNVLEERVLRRFNIYYTLTSRIFNQRRHELRVEN